MLLENSYLPKNTLIHNLNPLIKFLIFLSIVFLLFLQIPISVQLLLIGFVGLIVWQGDCKDVVQKSLSLYFLLAFFLFVVNFVFMKTPGFWLRGSLQNIYKDLFGIVSIRSDVADATEVSHGWYYGGIILRDKSKNIWLGEDYSCVEALLGIGEKNCSHELNNSNFSNLNRTSKWSFIPLMNGNNVKYVAFSSAWYTISAVQIIKAISLANKITLIIILSAVFTKTVSLTSFTYALEDLFRPLKLLKLPTEVMALVAAIAIRFAPSLIGEAFRIIRAQASRGIDYKNGNFKDKVFALLSLFVPLFVISFIKSGELASAMMARGYDTDHPRSSFRIHIVNLWELFILFVSMSFISFLYYLFVNGYYFGLFPSIEYLSFIAR